MKKIRIAVVTSHSAIADRINKGLDPNYLNNDVLEWCGVPVGSAVCGQLFDRMEFHHSVSLSEHGRLEFLAWLGNLMLKLRKPF